MHLWAVGVVVDTHSAGMLDCGIKEQQWGAGCRLCRMLSCGLVDRLNNLGLLVGAGRESAGVSKRVKRQLTLKRALLCAG